MVHRNAETLDDRVLHRRRDTGIEKDVLAQQLSQRFAIIGLDNYVVEVLAADAVGEEGKGSSIVGKEEADPGGSQK